MSSTTKAVSLEETPTWAVAVVCFVLVAISIVIEHLIHVVEKVMPMPSLNGLAR
jgi:mlo protein